MKKAKVLIIAGTRPEIIKVAPVLRKFEEDDRFDTKLVLTGQHKEMADPFVKFFGLKVERNLGLMKSSQSLGEFTSSAIKEVSKTIEALKPDLVMCHGDTSTAVASGLSSFYLRVPLAHIEAGLRSHNRESPFPEEINRRLVDHLSTLLFAPTEGAAKNLKQENLDSKMIHVTGNTVVDSLNIVMAKPFSWKKSDLSDLESSKSLVVVTVHRRENLSGNLDGICQALVDLAARFPKTIFVFPVHLNPQVQKVVKNALSGISNIILKEPMDYQSYLQLVRRAVLVISDSGGIQEEAPSLQTPVFLLRTSTERPEGIEAGCIKLLGTSPEKIVQEVSSFLNSETLQKSMVVASNPFGDGESSERIKKIVTDYLS